MGTTAQSGTILNSFSQLEATMERMKEDFLSADLASMGYSQVPPIHPMMPAKTVVWNSLAIEEVEAARERFPERKQIHLNLPKEQPKEEVVAMSELNDAVHVQNVKLASREGKRRKEPSIPTHLRELAESAVIKARQSGLTMSNTLSALTTNAALDLAAKEVWERMSARGVDTGEARPTCPQTPDYYYEDEWFR